MLEVDRDNLWQVAFSFYKKLENSEVNRPIRIKFNGVEQGIDAGGPRKEYFQLLANKIASEEVGLFEGSSEKCLLPAMKSSSLRLGHLKLIGKAIAHSVANGGIGV